MESAVSARIGHTPYTAPNDGHTCVRTVHLSYAVVNWINRNWAHLTSKHPQSPQKMGEDDYGMFPKVFHLFLILRKADHPTIFHIFSISFLP